MRPKLHYLFFALPPTSSFFVVWYAFELIRRHMSSFFAREKEQAQKEEAVAALEGQAVCFVIAVALSVATWASFQHGSLINASTLLVQSFFYVLWSMATAPM